MKLRSNALEYLTSNLLGAPCNIVQGYIRKVIIDVPWMQILSKPIEIRIEDIHVILKASERYDPEFVKSQIIKAKKEKVA